jgi:hypothetical protein
MFSLAANDVKMGLKKQAKCLRDRLGFYLLCIGPDGLCIWRVQFNLGSINDAEFIDHLDDYQLLQHYLDSWR